MGGAGWLPPFGAANPAAPLATAHEPVPLSLEAAQTAFNTQTKLIYQIFAEKQQRHKEQEQQRMQQPGAAAAPPPLPQLAGAGGLNSCAAMLHEWASSELMGDLLGDEVLGGTAAAAAASAGPRGAGTTGALPTSPQSLEPAAQQPTQLEPWQQGVPHPAGRPLIWPQQVQHQPAVQQPPPVPQQLAVQQTLLAAAQPARQPAVQPGPAPAHAAPVLQPEFQMQQQGYPEHAHQWRGSDGRPRAACGGSVHICQAAPAQLAPVHAGPAGLPAWPHMPGDWPSWPPSISWPPGALYGDGRDPAGVRLPPEWTAAALAAEVQRLLQPQHALPAAPAPSADPAGW